jgi:hypothetical protein
MRQGFDEFCPSCAYASLLHGPEGRCYCLKLRYIMRRDRFPPIHGNFDKANACGYFKDKGAF